MAEHGVLVRDCGNKLGITSQFLRLVVRPRDDVAPLYHGLRGYLRTVSHRPEGNPALLAESGGASGVASWRVRAG
jgi:hypothetical protein